VQAIVIFGRLSDFAISALVVGCRSGGWIRTTDTAIMSRLLCL
jgi:hypothetical protein